MTTPSAPRRSTNYYAVAAMVALGTLMVASMLWFGSARGRPVQLTITAGSASGLRHSIAQSLAEPAVQRNVILNVSPTTGSRDALRQVNAGTLDLALAQGGLPTTAYENIRQVAVLHIEPLHLLVKSNETLTADHDHFTLQDLSHGWIQDSELTINVSSKGSGTNALATALLGFFGLKPGEDFQPTNLNYEQLMDPAVAKADLPDAVFTVSSLPSPLADYLISRRGYRPVELPVADAFRIDWSPAVDRSAERQVLRQHIVDATIPAFTYQVSPPVPAQPIKTLGTRLHLVANVNTPADAVENLVDAIYDPSFANSSEPVLTVSLLQSSAEFELHQGAATYLEKKTPIITENVVELTEQVLAILGSIFAGVLFVWQGLLFIRRRRRDRQFLSCIERVGQIEQRAMEFESDPNMDVDDLVRLQGELKQIKVDMIAQFQKGDIDGADTLSSFLMHVNDANENLTRTILHERSPRPARQRPRRAGLDDRKVVVDDPAAENDRSVVGEDR